jgi:TPR repeat protein
MDQPNESQGVATSVTDSSAEVSTRSADNVEDLVVNLYLRVANGSTCKDNWEQLYTIAADAGIPLAQAAVAHVYNTRNFGVVENDPTKALSFAKLCKDWLAQAAEGNNRYAQYFLGVFCEQEGSHIDRAILLYRQSAELGFPPAECRLADYYAQQGSAQYNPEQAFGLFKRASEKGHAEAQCNLGECYLKGFGTGTDHSKAAEAFSASSDQGFSRGQFCAGRCFEHGIGVKSDAA